MVSSWYRWVVVLASFLGHVIIYGISWTSGIFYEIFKDEFNAHSSATSLMTSLNTALVYGAGPLSGVLTNRFGHRTVAICGSLVTMVGLGLSALATSSNHLIITFGVISGFGLGLSYIPFISIIGPHFDGSSYMSVALGLAACGTGIGTLVFPPLLRYLINHYTWKGALLISGGICLNLCVVGAILRPVEQKKVATRKRIGDCKVNFREIVRCQVFLSKHYLALCANSVFLCFGLSIVYVHLAAYSESIGCGVEQSALLYSVVGGANFCGRVFFGLLANQRRIGSMLCYVVALFFCGLATCMSPLAVNYAGLVTYSTSFGFLSASIGPLTPKIMIDILDTASLASAYGYLLVFEAVGQLLGAPAAGWLYDWTEFYPSSFYLAGSSLLLSALIMLPSLRVHLSSANPYSNEDQKVKDKEEEMEKQEEGADVENGLGLLSNSATEETSKY